MIIYAYAVADPKKRDALREAVAHDDPEALHALRIAAFRLLQMAHLAPADVLAMDNAERMAAFEAADLLRRINARLIADMLAGGKVAAAALAPVDGGRTLEDEVCLYLLRRGGS